MFTPSSLVSVQPNNSLERCFALTCLLLGLGVVTAAIGTISASMNQLRHLNSDIATQRDFLQRFLTERRVSLDTQARIFAFVKLDRYKKSRVREQDIRIFHNLPQSLKARLRWEIYRTGLLSHPLFFHIGSLDTQLAMELCTESLRERALLSGQECFRFAMKSESMMLVSLGTLDYFAGPEIGSNAIMVSKNTWMCEMVLWIMWFHRGHLVAKEAVELVELDASEFHRMIKHRGKSFRHCRAYAERYVDLLLKSISDHGLSSLTDLYGDMDDLRDLVHEASTSPVANIAFKGFLQDA